MSHEFEAAAADAFGALGGRRRKHAAEPGARCANCGAELHGPWCHDCGQDSDTHKRSIGHLLWEAIEGLLHLDGRLLRTLPDLFLRPGRLARDYMEGRIVRHVPPFRTFLVALLLFVFAAEHATHEATLEGQRQQAAKAALLATPAGRAKEVARLRAEAVKDRDEKLADAAKDRAEEIRDGDPHRDRVEARYAKRVANVQTGYRFVMDRADRLEKGLPPPTKAEVAARSGLTINGKSDNWFSTGIHKAVANPEFYLTVLFTWGHRLAILLLPIVGLSLALVYRNRPQFFVYDHLLVAMNLLSFVFLTNAIGLVLPGPLMGWVLTLAALWTPINLYQTLRGAYGSSILGAGLKTAIVWMITVFAFSTLVTGLLVFSLTQI